MTWLYYSQLVVHGLCEAHAPGLQVELTVVVIDEVVPDHVVVLVSGLEARVAEVSLQQTVSLITLYLFWLPEQFNERNNIT